MSFKTRGPEDALPASHFDDYSGSLGKEAASILRDPNSTYQPIPAKELVEEYNRRNPLAKITRRFGTVRHGSIESYRGGMSWTPGPKAIQAFLRSARSQPDYHTLKRAIGVNNEVERAGSAQDAIIMHMKNLGFSNDFPFGLMVNISGIRGNLYVENQRGIVYLPPLVPHTVPSETAQTVHSLPPNTDVHEAFLLDSIDEKTLRDEVLDVPGRPDIKVIKAGMEAHIARILASEHNAEPLMQRVKFDAKTHMIESLNRVGELMTVDTDVVELAIQGFKTTKDDHENLIPRTDFTEYKVTFTPVSSRENVGWHNIEQHEVFDGLGKEQLQAELTNPKHHAHIETEIEYIFKDAFLRNRLFPQAE
jgi:hypothetical protein